MMTKNKTARKYTSRAIRNLMEESSTVQKLQVVTKMKIAARLDDFLDERSWTKSVFAAKMNKNPSEITKWLSGTHNFTLDTLSEIACVLGIPVIELIDQTQEPSTKKIHIVVRSVVNSSPITILTPFEEIWSKTSEYKSQNSLLKAVSSYYKMGVC